MNELQQKFLGGYVAIRFSGNKSDFENFTLWMGEKNLFLVDGTPASKLTYPGKTTFAVYRTDSGNVYWSPVVDIDQDIYILEDYQRVFNQVSEPMEAQAEVVHEIINIEDVPEMKIDSITPAKINGNIEEFKDKMIPCIKQYKNTIVTEENHKDIAKLITRLNKSKKIINDYKIDVNKEANKEVLIFINTVKEILDTYEVVTSHLKTQVDKFKEDEKEARRKEKVAKIEQLKKALIDNGMLRKEFADKFLFDETWLNASCTNKRFEEEAEKQFNELISEQKNLDEATESIKQLIIAQKLPDGLMTNTKFYIQLYVKGTALADIVTSISLDAERIKSSLEKERQKAVEDSKPQIIAEVVEQQKQEQVQIVQEAPNAPVIEENSTIRHIDEATGEVYAISTDDAVKIKLQECPSNVDENKIFTYQYEFEGNFRAIKTFSLFLKVLAKINNTFKYRKVK